MARRSNTPGCGCGGCLGFLFGWVTLAYVLLLPITLPELLAVQEHGPRTTTPVQDIGLWTASALVVLALAWGAQGRRRPSPPTLLLHTALFSASAALAFWGATWANRSIAAYARTHPTAGAASPTELPWSFTATLETVAAAGAMMITFHAVRRWCRRDDPPQRVVIHGPRPGTDRDRPGSTDREVRRPRTGEIWLADVPLREDDSQTLQHYCVVVRNHAAYADVMQITSKDKTGRRDFIPIPNDGWDYTEYDHWLDVALPPRRVSYAGFLKSTPQGRCPQQTWQAITQIMNHPRPSHQTNKARTRRPTGDPRPPHGSRRSGQRR
ncbi:hypothetical protein ABZ915_32190 [Streptomyces sp. NPDC046915]|uniref:hypothetical protein n=1 Tax=Streptomyces sp. NPDC046915 TaxID=3155257 RepID=UPI0033D53348